MLLYDDYYYYYKCDFSLQMLQTVNTIGNCQRPLTSHLTHKVVCFQMLEIKFQYFSGKISYFVKTLLLQRAFSHNVLYYQQLSIACYQNTK